MNAHGLLIDVVLLLGAAVAIVPLAQRVGLGSVLGYLVAGVLIGPGGFGLVTATESIGQVSSLGVVFLLFIIGLELEPQRLWAWKMQIFGMGSAQILLVTGFVTAAGAAFGLSVTTGLVIGLGLAMSSTAISSQILRDRNWLGTNGGSSAFSILLFQDMAVIPILASLPLLAGAGGNADSEPVWKILVVIAGVIVAGRFLLRHVLRVVASAGQREVFTALSLLIVTGLAALMASLGVSMGLGAFLGGVLLATSEYRRAIETDIEPFKGILLGLFFMSVGMEVDVATIVARPGLVSAVLIGVLAVKIVSHGLLAWLFRMSRREIPLFSLVLAQVGEFAFVLFGAATALHLLTPTQTAVLSAAAALSMGTTPLFTRLYDRLWAPRLAPPKDMSDEVVQDDHPEVIIAGFGRVGQIIGRLLYANRVRATVLDHDPDQIELVRRFGFKVYYGDVTRLDLLEAAGARNAKILVVAIDNVESSVQVVDLAKAHFPHLRLVVRARNVNHVYQLIDRKVEIWERETFDSSLRLGTEVLRMMGLSPYQAVRTGHKFRDHNIRMIYDMESKRTNQRALVSAATQAREDLAKMFAGESESLRQADKPWDLHPERPLD